MLLFLTGDVQIGKTRWLQAQITRLQGRGVAVGGVLAPGDWVKRPAGQLGTEADRGMAGAGRYEKRGINNLLLPQGQLIPFARRKDLAAAEGSADPHSQSARAQLGWAIDDRAISRVNDHLAGLLQDPPAQPGLLVIDELGRLELMRGEGLTSAMTLLEAGPSPVAHHALVVVRAGLLDTALQLAADRFSAWGEIRAIGPTEEAAALLDQLFPV